MFVPRLHCSIPWCGTNIRHICRVLIIVCVCGSVKKNEDRLHELVTEKAFPVSIYMLICMLLMYYDAHCLCYTAGTAVFKN